MMADKTLTGATKLVRLRNSVSGRYYGAGDWQRTYEKAELVSLSEVGELMSNEEVVDDSVKPFRTYQSSCKTYTEYRYKGHHLIVERRRSSKWRGTWTTVSIDGVRSSAGNLKEAVKLISDDDGQAH